MFVCVSCLENRMETWTEEKRIVGRSSVVQKSKVVITDACGELKYDSFK